MRNHILLEVGDDGVALVTLNVAGSAINVFTPEFTSELQAVVDQLASRTDIVGAVITSGKPKSFMAGGALPYVAPPHALGALPHQPARTLRAPPPAPPPPGRHGHTPPAPRTHA